MRELGLVQQIQKGKGKALGRNKLEHNPIGFLRIDSPGTPMADQVGVPCSNRDLRHSTPQGESILEVLA